MPQKSLEWTKNGSVERGAKLSLINGGQIQHTATKTKKNSQTFTGNRDTDRKRDWAGKRGLRCFILKKAGVVEM